MVNNRVCAMLGCKYPIIEGGLAYVGNGVLAAAISNAGGFGQIGCGGRSVADLESQIEAALATTDQPIGVNLPISEHRNPEDYIAAILKYRKHLKAVSLSAGNPRPFIERLREAGLVVMTLASTPSQAKKAEQAGADIVICEGTEAGGHNGPAELTTFSLIPGAVDAVRIPVVAAGGIADGRTMAAALSLGAEAVQMGTRFVATEECQAHHNYKELIVSAAAEDTIVMERSLGHITRVLKSAYSQEVVAQEQRTPGDMEKLLPMVSGRMNGVAALEGRVGEGYMNCGQSVGLVHSVRTAREVILTTMTELQHVLHMRTTRIPLPSSET